MNNDKKEYPINGLEQDCISKKNRNILAYVSNIAGIKKFAKKQLNRRFRRFNKQYIG
jgi:ADP-dependent phosphofructokinase/glucokinase